MVADVYRPAGGSPSPAMILLLGVNPLPRSDPQVVTLADGIARTGIVTVVAESQALLDGEIRPEEVDSLVALFQLLERDPGVDPTRIGFAGFCVGAVLELLAAADPRIADRVAYVNAFSVYADAVDVLRAILTETQPGPNGPEMWTPNSLTRQVFVRHIVSQLPAEQDRRILTSAFVDAASPSPQEMALLTSLGRGVYDLLANKDGAQFDRLLGNLPPEYLDPLKRLSPRYSADRIRARVYLMHDVGDGYLPVAGARQLAATMPSATRVQYTEFQMFSHVVPGQVDDRMQLTGEMLKLFRHINDVLMTAHTGRS